MIEDPLVAPTTPGTVLERLTFVAGALDRLPALQTPLIATEPLASQLVARRDALLTALTAGELNEVRQAFEAGQIALNHTYEALCRPGLLDGEDTTAAFAALRFPPPKQEGVGKVDIATVLVTFSKPVRQVLTNITFADAPGAIGYRLREVRYLRGEELEDDTVESALPQFRRVRLPVGVHHFRIESRNPSVIALSELLTFEVPQL